MNSKDLKAIRGIRLDLVKLYDAATLESREELEVRILRMRSDLEMHLSKTYASGLCEACAKA